MAALQCIKSHFCNKLVWNKVFLNPCSIHTGMNSVRRLNTYSINTLWYVLVKSVYPEQNWLSLVLNFFCSTEVCHAAQHTQTAGSLLKVVLKKKDTNRNLFQHLLKKPQKDTLPAYFFKGRSWATCICVYLCLALIQFDIL